MINKKRENRFCIPSLKKYPHSPPVHSFGLTQLFLKTLNGRNSSFLCSFETTMARCWMSPLPFLVLLESETLSDLGSNSTWLVPSATSKTSVGMQPGGKETQRYVGILFTCAIITLSFTSFEVLLRAVPMGAVNPVRTSDSEFNETLFRSQVSIPACFFCFVFSVWSSVNCCNFSWRSCDSVCSLATLREVSEL